MKTVPWSSGGHNRGGSVSRARAARAREPLGWRRGEGRRAAFGRRAVGDDGAVHGGGGCSAEREEKLAPRRGTLVVAPPRWVTRTQGPVGGEHARDVAGLGGELDEAHASGAAVDGAGGDIDREDAAQQPRPRMARRRLGRRGRRDVGGNEERELRGRARRLATEDDLGARGRVSGEHAVVAQHVEARGRDEGAEPPDEVERVEQDGVGAVPPGGLEAEARGRRRAAPGGPG